MGIEKVTFMQARYMVAFLSKTEAIFAYHDDE